MKGLIEVNPWRALRRFTPARIALGRAGDSLPTQALLDFGLAHAQARDAVHVPLDVADVQRQLVATGYPSMVVRSAAVDRHQYLRRPDAGRRLDATSRAQLQACPPSAHLSVAFVIADGLSATAVARHAVPLLQALHPLLDGDAKSIVVIALQARVALGDEIGELLGAEQTVMLIGERPGLSSADSLGIYFTHAPRTGRTDAERNCISNVRPEGLDYVQAARKLSFLLKGARRLGCSGLALEAESDQLHLSAPET